MANTGRVRPSLEDYSNFQRASCFLGMEEGTQTTASLKAYSIPVIASRTGVAKSTLLASLKHINQSLGMPPHEEGPVGVLTLRPGGKWTLSTTGMVYFDKVCRILRLHREAATVSMQRPEPLIIGAYNSLLSSYLPLALGPLVQNRAFRERVALRLRDCTLEQILAAVDDGDIDFAIGSEPIGSEKRMVRGRAEVVPFPFDIERVLIYHKDHDFAFADSVEPEDVAKEVLLRFPPEDSTPGLTTWIPADVLAGGTTVDLRTFSAILQWVRLGFGVSVAAYLPGEIEKAVVDGEVCCRPLPEGSRATVAAFLPRGGEKALSEVALEAYKAVRNYFTNTKPLRAPKPTIKRRPATKQK